MVQNLADRVRPWLQVYKPELTERIADFGPDDISILDQFKLNLDYGLARMSGFQKYALHLALYSLCPSPFTPTSIY